MKNFTLISITLTACLITLSSTSMVLAASPAAKVVYATGEVSARDTGGTRRLLQKGDIIASGDAVVPGKGRAQLKLTDGGFVALDPNTEYVIEDYRLDQASPDSGRSFFNLVRGGMRFVTGAIGKVKRKNWRMRTAVATIGNRRLCALRRRFTERPLRRRLRGYSRGDRGQIRHGRFRIFHYAFDAQIDVRQRNEVRRLANQCFWACVHQNLVCIPGIFDIVAIRCPVRGVPDPTSIRPKSGKLDHFGKRVDYFVANVSKKNPSKLKLLDSLSSPRKNLIFINILYCYPQETVS